MKNLIYIFLFLSGCATIPTENEFYHRFSTKPVIVEKSLGNGEWLETLPNPYEVPIVATVDCDNEQKQRTITVKSNSEISFHTKSDTDHNCSVLHWEVK